MVKLLFTMLGTIAEGEISMRTKKKVLIGIGVVIFVAVSYHFVFSQVIVTGRAMGYVDAYQDFYYMAELSPGFFNVGQTTTVMHVHFLPGQRGRMCDRIKADIINSLEMLVTEHGDYFYKYEISDEFQAHIYQVSEDWRWRAGPKRISNTIRQIESLVELYHNIKEGHSVAMNDPIILVTCMPENP